MRVHPRQERLSDLTAAWTGDRDDFGRPWVPEAVIGALAWATTEHAWRVLHLAGYDRQFAGGWRQTQPGRVIVGRAVTAQFLPHRPDYDAAVVGAGAREGHSEADKQNSWVIESLQPGDVMVVDIFGKVRSGTVIGDNLGTAVASRTGVGAVIDGGVRDLQGLIELDKINIYYRDCDPTPIADVTLAGINIPIRIGAATVLPGDVVLGTPSGLIFIPPHLAEDVVRVSREVQDRDTFGKQRLSEQAYTTAEIDVDAWPEHIESDFRRWRDQRS